MNHRPAEFAEYVCSYRGGGVPSRIVRLLQFFSQHGDQGGDEGNDQWTDKNPDEPKC